jgi:hypothetical protein
MRMENELSEFFCNVANPEGAVDVKVPVFVRSLDP